MPTKYIIQILPKSITLYFFLTLFFFSKTYSQSPGYMGKRFLIGYGFHTSPAIFGANANGSSIIGNSSGNSETGSLAFNVLHEGYAEVVTSSKWTACFSVRYYKTKYDNHESVNYIANNINSTYNVNGLYDIRGLTYTLYFKYYGKRYVAPWGRYVMFGPTINTVKTSYDPAIMNIKELGNYYTPATTLSDFGPKEQTFSGVNLMLGWGRNRIIADRITIDYGCNLQLFAVLAGAFDLVFEDGGNFFATRTTNLNYMENTYKQRVRGINRFNVFLKVGYLF